MTVTVLDRALVAGDAGRVTGERQEGPDLSLARATSDLAQGRLDEAAAHLTVAEPRSHRRRQTASTASKWRLRR
jgi:hypothetical protein